MNAFRLLLPSLMLLICASAFAQDTGQICIQSYADADGSGSRDDDEPAISQGVAANLMSALGVTIDTQLLENSISAAIGLTCFEHLPAGDYVVVLTSVQYEATTAPSFNALVVPGTAPVLYEFGLAPIRNERDISIDAEGRLSEAENRALQAMALALAGSGLVAGIVFLLGLLLYMGVFRRRLRKARQSRLAPVHGSPPQAAPSAPAQPMPFSPLAAGATTDDPFGLHQGSPQLFDQDDTNPLA